MNSFYSLEELYKIGFKSVGEKVYISKKVSIYSPEKITIGNNVRIDDFSILSGEIIIGNYVHIANYVALYGGGSIILSDFVGISSRSVIYSATDDYSGKSLTNPTIPDEFRNVEKGRVLLNRHALIGTGTTILPGVVIGEGTSVGAMSLVNKDLDSWSIYYGIPAKRVKERNKELLIIEREFLKV